MSTIAEIEAKIETEYRKQQNALLVSYNALVRFAGNPLSYLTSATTSHKSLDRLAEAITSNKQQDYMSVYPADTYTYGDKFDSGWYCMDLCDRFSDLLTESNADYIIDNVYGFIKRHSPNIELTNLNGLTVLFFRVYVATADLAYTPEFAFIAEVIKDLESYPALDSDDYSERQLEATLDNIESELHSLCSEYVNADIAKTVWDWLWDNDQEALDGDNGIGYPSDDQLENACRALNIALESDEDN